VHAHTHTETKSIPSVPQATSFANGQGWARGVCREDPHPRGMGAFCWLPAFPSGHQHSSHSAGSLLRGEENTPWAITALNMFLGPNCACPLPHAAVNMLILIELVLNTLEREENQTPVFRFRSHLSCYKSGANPQAPVELPGICIYVTEIIIWSGSI